MKNDRIELVYFIFPSCDGQCKHCWSSDIMLGRYRSTNWHKKLIDAIKIKDFSYKVIKLSGGEPFFHKGIGEISSYIHNVLGQDIRIEIFTSGRTFVSIKEGREGIEETYNALLGIFKDFSNLSIQLSADEFHLQVLQDKYGWENKEALLMFQQYLTNFVSACLKIKEDNPKFLGPKLKVHCATGRKAYHQNQLLGWVPNHWWTMIELTEGLVYSGRAKDLSDSFKIEPSDKISYFLLPGVDIYTTPQTPRAEKFHSKNGEVYLDDAGDSALMIYGWWNLINREAVYNKITIVQ